MYIALHGAKEIFDRDYGSEASDGSEQDASDRKWGSVSLLNNVHI